MDANEFPNKNKDSAAPANDSADAVDDILRDIMNPDGSFNTEFSELFSRYLGGSVSDMVFSDLSDRTDEIRPRAHADYERPAAGRRETVEQPAMPRVNEKLPPDAREMYDREARNAAQRVNEKLSEDVREIYDREARRAARPEFTNEGTVRYPSMGVGASEERVVFDADWEEKAKKEAARREKIRRENMLRGDSAYTRSFRFTSAEEGYRPPNVNSAFIDPLDDSRDVPIFTNRRPERKQGPDEEDERDGGSFFRKVFPSSKK